MKLWYHESCRVFQDRLVNDTDRAWFDNLLKSYIKDNFNLDVLSMLGTAAILYGDFLDPNVDFKQYVQITDMNKVKNKCFSL